MTARTRSSRPRLPLLVAANAMVLVMAALFAAVAIQPAAAQRSDFSRVTLTPAEREASCTATQKADRQAALRAYQKRMIAQRRAYFRAYTSVKLRRAFVKSQRARLKALQAAAACTVPPPPIDTTAPAVPAITGSPANPTKQTSATFSFTGEAGATFQCALDAGAFAACSSGVNYPGPLAEGSHTFQVKQTDTAGNTGAAASYTWTVDTGPLPAPPPGPNTSFTFDSGITAADQDEIKGDVAYAVQDEAVLLGAPITSVRTFVSNSPDWLADQQCRFSGSGGDCFQNLQQLYASGTTATSDPGGIFLYWAAPSWRSGASQNQKIIAHELFHVFQYQLDKLSNAPSSQVWPSGPVWLHEGAPEMVGYRVAVDRRLFPSYASVLTGQISRAKQISTPLNSLQTYNEAQIPNVYSLFHVAVDHLVSITPAGVPALTTYLNALGAGRVWQDAFQAAFGMSVDAYYANCAAYRAGL